MPLLAYLRVLLQKNLEVNKHHHMLKFQVEPNGNYLFPTNIFSIVMYSRVHVKRMVEIICNVFS